MQPRAGAAVLAVHAAREDQLVFQRVLPPGQLRHRDLIPERLEHQRADDVRQVGARLASMERVRPEERPRLHSGIGLLLELCRELRLATRNDGNVIGVPAH